MKEVCISLMPNFVPSPTTRDLTEEQIRKLRELIEEYLRNLNKQTTCSGCCEADLKYWRKLEWPEAIQHVAMAENCDGRRHPHQRRISHDALAKSYSILLDHVNQLQGCTDFDTLLELIRRLLKQVNGVGALYYYDTAFRIGLSLRFYPQCVYLHAGTRIFPSPSTLRIVCFP